ncbi:VOC family protein [Caulobacter mirabilis]|uniref:Glyoxalase n=1 Tax=Caulobacter mirabilis TaxID=69666 RepID=A0A2D2AX44_9CAUL|nr:VOC family protein [Caulobacter mirabilis]ATQ42588.1 glyoxalase [Caulobacter mirabilis]
MTERLEREIGLWPYITIRDGRAREALDWYAKALGAEVAYSADAQDGKRVMHATLRVNGSWLMLSDDFPEHGGGTPAPAAVTLHLTVDDADPWWDRALAAGAEVRMPLEDQFWGDRYGQFSDPFGHRWSVGGPAKG